jgi:hypothetical protein
VHSDLPSLKAALEDVEKTDDLSPADCAQLREWAKWINDPVWGRVAVSAEAYNPRLVPRGSVFRTIIRYALTARRVADAADSGRDLFLEENEQWRRKLLELADKADELARFYQEVEQYSGIASSYQTALMPVGELKQLHEQEAQLLRQHAGKEHRPTVRVSRRKRFRKQAAFSIFMVEQLRLHCGRPHYAAVEMMFNIAYPTADVVKDVRSFTRPTKRATRKSGTHAP